jgi:hypothetical protein
VRRRRAAQPLSVAPTSPRYEPDLAPEHKAAVLAALRWAWAELRRDRPHLLQSGDEESVTEALQELLNAYDGGVRRASWIQDFGTVSRSEKQRTSDNRLHKQPDLTFRPLPYSRVTNSTRWGWFVECKIVDGAATVTAYRDEGVQRFALGEYAAWMQSGAMLAYVRDGSRPATTLEPVLRGRVGTRRLAAGASQDLGESEHARDALTNPCVDVTLTHIWLVV